MDYGVTTLNITLAFGALLTMSMLVAGHWAPWRFHRLVAYTYGCVSILAGFAVWQYPNWPVIGGLAVLIGCGGAVTIGLYALDDYRDAKRKIRLAEMEHGGQ